jgi:hypothetical protein
VRRRCCTDCRRGMPGEAKSSREAATPRAGSVAPTTTKTAQLPSQKAARMYRPTGARHPEDLTVPTSKSAVLFVALTLSLACFSINSGPV